MQVNRLCRLLQMLIIALALVGCVLEAPNPAEQKHLTEGPLSASSDELQAVPHSKLPLDFTAITASQLYCALFENHSFCRRENHGSQANRSIPGHPRLFFQASDVPALRERAETTHHDIWQAIRAYVETEIALAPPAVAPAHGDLDTYRNYGNQLMGFAFACVIADDERYCTLAKRHLLAYTAWEQWDVEAQRGLGLAHMLLGNLLAYDWLHDQLTPAEQERVRESLGRWSAALYAASIGPKDEAWNNWWYKSYIQNHYTINNSVLGMAGLGLMGEDDRAALWFEQAYTQLARTQLLLNGIEDGSWHEGLSYQNYMLSMSIPFWLNARRLYAVDLIPHHYLPNYITWRLYNYLPNTVRYIMAHGNFEWSYINSRNLNVLRFAAAEYRNGYAEWIAQRYLETEPRASNIWSTPWHVFEFFYYQPTVTATPPTDLPLGRTFTDLEGVIWRSGWGPDDLVFGLKTGAYGGRYAFDTFHNRVAPWDADCAASGCRFNLGHNHDDTNGFYLFRSGVWLAPEMVGYDASATEYHNTLLIDGQGQQRAAYESTSGPGPLVGTDGALLRATHGDSFAYLAADATQRYRHIHDLQSVSRHVTFVRPDYFLMVDNLVAQQPHRFEWVSHFDENATLDGDWVRGHAAGGQVLGVNILHPRPFVTIFAEHRNLPYVRIRPASDVAQVRFVNLLYPTNRTQWAQRPTATLLDDSGEALLVRVQMNDGSGQYDDIIITYTQTDMPVTIGPYAYDGHTAVIHYDSNGEWTQVAVDGATFLQSKANNIGMTDLDPTIPTEFVRS